MFPSPTTTSRPGKRKRENSTQNGEDASAAGDLPLRDIAALFAERVTAQCAQRCIPCAYKIGCFDVALDHEFTRAVPNQRPEQCPRAKSNEAQEGTLGYRRGMNVLTIGDGDLSFSLAVARILFSKRNGESRNGRLIATSYESRATLERVYPNFRKTLSELECLGAQVFYQVDTTRLSDTLPILNATEPKLQFHRIVWNFPCTAIQSGQDGQNEKMEENKDLVRHFVRGARHLLCNEGEIHMSHKTKPPYNQWNLEEIALEECNGAPTVKYLGRIVLDRFTLPPYTPRKALDRKSFPCHDACTYVFGITGKMKDSSGDSFPSTIPDDTESSVEADDEQRESIVPVSRELITSIRQLHLSRTMQQDRHRKKHKKKYK